jgi:pimeloyl-ACP methyl ester carboxylesterase
MSDALEQWAATEQLNQIKSRILLIAGEHDHTPLSEKLFLAARLRSVDLRQDHRYIQYLSQKWPSS